MLTHFPQLRAFGTALLILLVTGCANSPMLSDAGSATQTGNVIGSFDLVKNGHAVDLNHQPLGNRAYIHVSQSNMRPVSKTLVRKDGQFSLDLKPGHYVIDTIAFEHHGELIETQSNFRFQVEAADMTYIGAMQLEVSLDNSALGVVGTADRFTVANGCGDNCEADISIMRWNHQTAQVR